MIGDVVYASAMYGNAAYLSDRMCYSILGRDSHAGLSTIDKLYLDSDEIGVIEAVDFILENSGIQWLYSVSWSPHPEISQAGKDIAPWRIPFR